MRAIAQARKDLTTPGQPWPTKGRHGGWGCLKATQTHGCIATSGSNRMQMRARRSRSIEEELRSANAPSVHATETTRNAREECYVK